MNPTGGNKMRHKKTRHQQLNGWMAIIGMTLCTILSSTSETSGQGTFTNIKFYSISLQMERNVQIYLPEGYNEQDSIRYPVVYFLHGATLDHNAYQNLLGILNSLIDEAKISPVIVVKPDGSVGPWNGSFYTNSELYGNFEDYIIHDLPAYVDSTYKTIATRDKRAIMGHSMGGYGAMKIALKHPDQYCAVASHSGPLDFSHFPDRIPGIVAENGGVPVSEYVPSMERFLTTLFYTLAGAFSPNLDHPPYLVDFPIDSMGNPIDSVFHRWSLNDPACLAADMDRSSRMAIYFDCGEQDELQTFPFNTGFADSLDKLGISYDFQPFTGGHMNQLASRLLVSLQFLDSAMNQTVNNVEEGVWIYKSPMPTARSFLGACILKGKIYAIGGATGVMTFSSALEVYDPLTDTWTQKANMPMALCYPNVCAINGKIYVLGGATAMFSGVVPTSFVYDPERDEWTAIGDSPHVFGDPCIAVLDEKAYLIGGSIDGSNVPVSDVNVFDPATEAWTQKTAMPTPRSMLAASVFHRKIYCFGGTTENWTTDFYADVESYDPGTDSWENKNEMPLGRWSPSACVLDNLIYVTGGHHGSNACDRVDILDPESGDWVSGPPLQQIRQGHESCVLDGKIYVMGGSYAENGMPGFLTSLEVFDLYHPESSLNIKADNHQSGNYLSQNYPNPFHSNTNISFCLQTRQMVSLKMYDSLGRQITVLVNEVKQPGEYVITFNAAGLPDGIYLCRFDAGGCTQTRKCLLLSQN
jgi:S-formylglutathione hydrolase FrmB/N-acetylneuraminic acid mutarotase